MSEAATCAHRMPSGHTCQSPAVKGTTLCYHHTALQGVTSQTAGLQRLSQGSWQPLPFVFPEDRAALQMNYFALLRAFNAQAIDMRTFNAMHRILRSMAANLGKTTLTQEPATAPAEPPENQPLQTAPDEPQGSAPSPSAAHTTSARNLEDSPLALSATAPFHAPKPSEEPESRHRLAKEIYFGRKSHRR